MTHIKINYTNVNGKRSSTTINRNIAFHFYIAIKATESQELPDDYEDRIRRTVQRFVNESEYQYDKDRIENELLHEIQRLTLKRLTDNLN